MFVWWLQALPVPVPEQLGPTGARRAAVSRRLCGPSRLQKPQARGAARVCTSGPPALRQTGPGPLLASPGHAVPHTPAPRTGALAAREAVAVVAVAGCREARLELAGTERAGREGRLQRTRSECALETVALGGRGQMLEREEASGSRERGEEG